MIRYQDDTSCRWDQKPPLTPLLKQDGSLDVKPGRITLEMIEVHIGGYLADDDIIRFDDQYGR